MMSPEGYKQKKESSEVQRSNLLSLVEPPDLGSVERSETRSPKSVSRCLLVASEFPFTQQQLFNLFNLIPGLESCDLSQGLYSNRAYAVVQYNNAASAIYAKHKLHGFEYPFGSWLLVTFIEEGTDQTKFVKRRAKQIPSTILNTSSSFQFPGSSEFQSSSPLQTDAELLSSKRKTPSDSSVWEKLFIMFHPHPLPPDILCDILRRFANFINVYLIPGENMAYAKFADRASASDTMAVLDGKTVNGVKLKLKLADLPTEDPNKRQRTL